MPLFPGMPSFPGDPPLSLSPLRSRAHRDAYDLSTLSIGTHTGTHVDPPSHFVTGAASVDEVDLEALNGPCRVAEVPAGATSAGAEVVRGIPKGSERVLFRTSNSARWARSLSFFSDYVALDPTAAEALLERRVRSVGIDALSIENDPSEAYPVHHRLLRHGTAVLEGLLLADAPGGAYRLECLPLRIRHGDGGPARAALVAP